MPAQRITIPLEVCIADCHAAEHRPTGLISWQSVRVPFCAASLAFHGIWVIEAFELGVVHAHLVRSFHEVVSQIAVTRRNKVGIIGGIFAGLILQHIPANLAKAA